MCIIATKKKGIANIDWDKIDNMFDFNDDGAGYMYTFSGATCVTIKKGFMTVTALKKSLKKVFKKHDIADLSLVLHFRIGTHGGNTPQNTHPFMISENMKDMERLHATTDIGVVMNGILNIDVPKKATYSDTMLFITTQLNLNKELNKDFLKNEYFRDYMNYATGVKWTFLEANGHITNIGDFNNCDGWDYSNYSYQPLYGYSKWGGVYSSSAWDSYSTQGTWDDEEYFKSHNANGTLTNTKRIERALNGNTIYGVELSDCLVFLPSGSYMDANANILYLDKDNVVTNYVGAVINYKYITSYNGEDITYSDLI